jgi:hypothetical protein
MMMIGVSIAAFNCANKNRKERKHKHVAYLKEWKESFPHSEKGLSLPP